jgi:hypothetical protein
MSVDAQGKPDAYKIIIDEEQRQIIVNALVTLMQYTPTIGEEIDVLYDLFRNLPKEEKANPGVLHGFCY